MARRPGVCEKNGSWYSEAGGKARYFGSTRTTTKNEAMSRLFLALDEDKDGDRRGSGSATVGVQDSPTTTGRKEITPRGRSRDQPPPELFPSFLPAGLDPTTNPGSKTLPLLSTITVAALIDLFLAWLGRHRSAKTHAERSRHLSRFGAAYGGLDAVKVQGTHLEAFRDGLKADGHALDYLLKHEISVGACFRWGVKHGHLPAGFSPFATVEPTRVPLRPLLESDLPTDAEVKALLAGAIDDDMRDILAVYHATGARTHELIEARAGDFQPQNKTIVLGRHKRSKTLRDPIPRTITLNEVAFAVLARRCKNRDADAIIFPRPSDGGWHTSNSIDERMQNIRNRAGVRPGITIYSFRHLWISEALMAGVDVLLVAKMAGTSVKMIESVYGHFKTQSFAAAQAKLDASRRALQS